MAAVKQQEQESHEEGNILLHACPKRVVLEEEDEARFVSFHRRVLAYVRSALTNGGIESLIGGICHKRPQIKKFAEK